MGKLRYWGLACFMVLGWGFVHAQSPLPAAEHSLSPSTQPGWGTEVSGLVVGLRAIKAAFVTGEPLEFELSVKNLSKDEIVLFHGGEPSFWYLLFYPNPEDKWLVWSGAVQHPEPPFTRLPLPPAQTVTLKLSSGWKTEMLDFGFYWATRAGREHKIRGMKALPEGNYRVKAGYSWLPSNPADHPGFWMGAIETGIVTITVKAAASQPANPTSQP